MPPSIASVKEIASAANTIKVMVVDDSAVVRGLVSRWLGEEEEIEIVARCSNGELAVNAIPSCQPDIIVLDIEMPVMDGLTALPLMLQAKSDIKVIMASTLTRHNAEISLKALSLGAVDYISKPESNCGVTTSRSFRSDLLAKIKAVSEKTLHLRVKRDQTTSDMAPQVIQTDGKNIALRSFSDRQPDVLVIGSSTGGPQALTTVFSDISAAISNVPVLVAQHMPETFTAILAENIGRITNRTAKEGKHHEVIQSGHIYVAPGGSHMRVGRWGGDRVIKIDAGPEINFCRPAVDPLFDSIAEIYGAGTLGIVLTGMGQDGAAGALNIAKVGGSIIAQDESTSVVWGMPGATAHIGACSAVLPLANIGMKINALLK